MNPNPFHRVQLSLPRWVVVVFVAAPLVMGALGAWAVVSGENEGKERLDIACRAVQGVRDDLVISLQTIRDKAIENATSEAEVRRIKVTYDTYLIKTIGDPKCP
jgi:hypothetical protein